MAKVKITDNTGTVKSTIQQKSSIFLRLMAESIVKIAEPNTPKDTGRLRADVIKQTLGLKGKVVWSKEYAARQESTQYSNYTTGGTGPHYAENAVSQAVKTTDKIAKSSGLI